MFILAQGLISFKHPLSLLIHFFGRTAKQDLAIGVGVGVGLLGATAAILLGAFLGGGRRGR